MYFFFFQKILTLSLGLYSINFSFFNKKISCLVKKNVDLKLNNRKNYLFFFAICPQGFIKGCLIFDLPPLG